MPALDIAFLTPADVGNAKLAKANSKGIVYLRKSFLLFREAFSSGISVVHLVAPFGK
jgi:hypothetical protein